MKKYNTTDLDPVTTFERHIFHRDQFAHYLRWSYVLKEIKKSETIIDFGCGKGNLFEVIYRNPPLILKKYIGIDIRKKTIEIAKEKFKVSNIPEFYADDLIFPTIDYKQFQGDKVCSFEVAEHVGKQNIETFLSNMRDCGNENATYYISTPNFDEHVGAAGNHTYDSGDGRGVAVQEFAHSELQSHIEKYFTIERKFGTFASIKDYKHLLNDWQVKMFEALKEYYDSNLLSVIMAPFFPEQSRNTLWVLKRK